MALHSAAVLSTKGQIGVRGLKTSGNRLTAGPGSLTEALNCFITSRDTLSTRRGQETQIWFQGGLSNANGYIDGDSTDAASNRAKELYQWGTALFCNYTGSGGYKLASFSAFATSPVRALVGSYTPPNPTRLRMKFAQLAQSLYWTTDAGLYALDVVGGTARAAGLRRQIIDGLDADSTSTRLTGNVSATGSWFAKNQTVAGRAVLGFVDTNNVVHESAASQRVIVVNPNDVTVAIGGLVRNTNVVTATVAAHKFRVGDKLNLTLTGGDVGNFDTTDNVVTAVTSTTIKWAETAANYVNVADVTITSGTKSIQWTVELTADATAGRFIRIYRTDEAAGEAVDPGDECFLAYERVITSTDVSNGYIQITDTTPADFLGDPLDSNANSGEGLLGVNERPPLCDDLCAWDGRLWGGKTTDLHRLSMRLLGTGSPNSLQNGDYIALNTLAYKGFTAGSSGYFQIHDAYFPTVNVDKTCDEFAMIATATQGFDLGKEHDGDTGLGEILVTQITPASTMALDSSGAISAIYAATTRTTAFGDRLATLKPITAANTSRAASTVTVRCSTHGFTQGQVIMLAYDKGGAGVDTNFPPGLKTVASVVDANNFTYTESGSAVTLSGATSYFAYATTYKSSNNPQPVRFTRSGLPEAWPLANTLGGLPDGADVLRIAPSGTGYSLLIFLKDGAIYRVSGEYPYVVRRLDDTASLVAADSLVPHAGRLHALTTQGICAITEAGVAVLGADVEDITRVVVNGIASGALDSSLVFGTSYESERQYMLSMPQEVAGSPGTITSTVYQSLAYNSLSGDFARESWQRTCGLVFRGRDLLVMGDALSNMLRIERKALTYTDYADAKQTCVVSGSQSSVSTVTIQAIATAPTAGDILTVYGTPYRVTGGTTTTVIISGTVSVSNLDPIYLFRSYQTQFTFTPDPGGAPGIEKRWREVQMHFGRNSFGTITATFTNERGASGTVTSTDSSFAIGTVDSDTLVRRIAVPQAVQMCAALIVTVTMQEAWSFFDLYGISATSEPVSERTGK